MCMKTTKIKLLTTVAVILTKISLIASPGIYPTGVTIYNPQKTYNSFVVFGSPDGKSHLIDMNGNEVKQWPYIGFPSEIIDPAINGGKKGHILVQLENGAGVWSGIFNNKVIGELDWNGKIVWQWGKEAPGGAARQNHDWNRLPNGNTLVVTTLDHVVPGVSDEIIDDQSIHEITPDGKIVWSWNAGDHLNEFGITPEGQELLRKSYAKGKKGHGFLTINDMQPIGPNKWFDSGDKRFDPENIVIDSREASFIAIIEKKSGKIIWRLGPNFDENKVDAKISNFVNTVNLRPTLETKVPRPIDQLSGQHDAHIIPDGLPGAGNLLVFDNEGASGFPPTRLSSQLGSRVLEINPINKEIVWQYTALNSNEPVWDFYSSFISSARRLPNGNTLIDEGMNGRIFQVTPLGEIVWEYVSPYFANAPLSGSQVIRTNWVFRAQPVPYNWIPEEVKYTEYAVEEVDLTQFHVPVKAK
jgi:Arylsulfotransferase (ASST)